MARVTRCDLKRGEQQETMMMRKRKRRSAPAGDVGPAYLPYNHSNYTRRTRNGLW
jgi:hypothetical protein